LAETKWVAADVQRLYRHYGAALVAFARSFLPDAPAAEDVVHSVFLKLLRKDVTAPESETPPVGTSTIALTKLALENPEGFDAVITKTSSQVLPTFMHRDSTLEALAKE